MPVTTIAEPQARSLSRTVLECLFHAVHEGIFSRPSRLMQMLRESPSMRVHIADSNTQIAQRSVVRWHEWGDPELLAWPQGGRGVVTGWRRVGGAYEMFQATIPALMAFAKCHSIVEWSCEIQDLSGFSNSQSDLSRFSSLDALVQSDARDLIRSISLDGLVKNLAHPGIGILRDPKTTDHFVRFAWDKRFFLDNADGSHHLAAARFIAKRIGESVPLPGLLRTYAVSEEAVRLINAEYYVFAISNDGMVREAFHQAMRSFKTSYLLHRLPSPIEGAVAVLLPRIESRSAVVAAAMREAGIFDIGAHLEHICARQASVI